jgi:DNA-binding PadR family transcriptional regulator
MALTDIAESLSMKPHGSKRRSHFDAATLLLLGVLMDGSKHGYEIKQMVDSRLSRVTDISSGTIYYTLKKLEKKRLVTRSQERSGNRPERRVYSITKEGQARFEELLKESFQQPDETYYFFDIGFYFLRFANFDDVLEAAKEKEAAIKAFLKSLKQLEEDNPGPWPFAYRALADRARMLGETNLEWYQGVMEEIHRRQDKKKNKKTQKEGVAP